MVGKKGTYSQTSPQRPPWGLKKVTIVEKWSLWGGRDVRTIVLGIQHVFFCGAFLLTVSHNHGNPIYIMCGDKVHKKLE